MIAELRLSRGIEQHIAEYRNHVAQFKSHLAESSSHLTESSIHKSEIKQLFSIKLAETRIYQVEFSFFRVE
jgi:hypothetical protein